MMARLIALALAALLALSGVASAGGSNRDAAITAALNKQELLKLAGFPSSGFVIGGGAGPACPNTADFVTDNFAGTAGTDLSAHAPNVPNVVGSWTYISQNPPQPTGGLTLDGAGYIYARPNTANETDYGFVYNTASNSCADYYVRMTVNTNYNNNDYYLLVRYIDTNNYYYCVNNGYYLGGGQYWSIVKYVAGTATTLANTSYAPQVVADTATCAIAGNVITLTTSQGVYLTGTDSASSITAPGKS